MSTQMSQPQTTNTAQSTIISTPRQVEIVEKAVAAVLDNFSKVEAAKDEMGKIEGGQLGILATALKDIPQPVTEEAWDTLFKDKVAELLANAPANGKPRYATKGSRNSMVRLFKIATMGLTLAKQNPDYDPAVTSATSLKKYTTIIRPKLQADPDPATGKPRLHSAEKRTTAPKKLTGDTYYWLIGCEDAEVGLNGMVGRNVVVCGEHDLRKLESHTAVLAGTYQSFGYIVGELKPMPIETHEIALNMDVASLILEDA